MTRRQVLDVGDQVTHAGTGAAGVVVQVEQVIDGPSYAVDWDSLWQRRTYSRVGWSPAQLVREGPELQLGDWARVEGECRSAQTGNTSVDLDGDVVLLVDTCTDEFGDEIFLVFRREMPSINAIAVPTQLTRITRAEALA